MKRTVNKKGFTLVELIVVMAILSVILGAILSLTRPINKLFAITQDAKETNDVTSDITSYVEDRVRYATNITVLKDYQGVPEVNNGIVGNSPSNMTRYTNVLIFDSNPTNVRGSSTNGYDATANANRRKGEYGQIINCDLATTGTIDFTQAEIALTEGLYGDYSHVFDINITNNSGRYYMETNIESYKPTLDGTTYRFNELVYDTTRAFELININLSTGCNVNDYLNTITSLNYSLYPQATAGSGLTAQQTAYYDTSKTYTYVFYTSTTPSRNSKCVLTYMDRNGNLVGTKKIKNGDCISETDYDSAKTMVDDQYTTINAVTGATETWKFRDYVEVSGVGGDLANYKTTGISYDMQFVAEYFLESTSALPTNKVHFYSIYTATGEERPSPEECSAYFIDNDTGSATYQMLKDVSGVPQAFIPVDKVFLGWFDASGNQYYEGMLFDPNTDYSFTASFADRSKYTVRFVVDGAEVSTLSDIYQDSIIESSNYPTEPTKADHAFVGWFTEENGAGLIISTAPITSETTFYAYFTPVVADLTVTSVSSPSIAWYDVVEYTIQITNTTSSDINRWQVDFECDSPLITGFAQTSDWRLTGNFASKKGTVYTNNDYTVPANSTATFKVRLSAPIAYDIQSGMEISNVTVKKI